MTPTAPRPANVPGGLSTAEAAARLARDGPNLLETAPRRAVIVQLLARFKNPLVLLLLAASTLEAATRDFVSATIIMAMIVLSVTMDFLQEHRAGRAAERLRRAARIRATVLRDARRRELPAEDLVVGSRPSRPLVLTSLAIVTIAIALPFLPIARALGFAPLPAIYFAVLFPLVVSYLVAVELVKRWFYRRHAPTTPTPARRTPRRVAPAPTPALES